MGLRLIRHIAIILAAIWVAVASAPAVAGQFAPGSVCHIFLSPGETRASVEQRPDRWTCDGTGWRIESARALVRLDLRNHDTPPRYFVTKLSDFERLTLTVTGTNGAQSSASFTPKTMVAAQTIYQMYAHLPSLPAGASALIADYEGPRYSGVITEATLSGTAPIGDDKVSETLVSMLCGLLLWPLLFVLAYFRVLKERFLLWYGITGFMVLIYTASTGGIIARFTPLSAETARDLTEWSLGLGFASVAMFFADYVEPGKLSRGQLRALRGLALGSIGLAVLDRFMLLPPTAMQLVFYAGWFPLLAVYVWLIGVAIHRGSRAAKFQAAAWAPQVLVSCYHLVGNLGWMPTAISTFVPFYFTISMEMIITAMGVADRMMSIKRDRDQARNEALVLGQLADCDSLTGLLNRRAVEARFEELIGDDFKTVAIVDLDHFKTINDTRGHTVGDAVLKVVADVLTPDDDTLAVRLGGEEFMLLLRGKNAAEKAERLRTAIPTRVATLVPGLENLVTASMGLVELPQHGRLQYSFASLYSQCDRLLYEAKNTGRNRMMRERMQSFGETGARAAA